MVKVDFKNRIRDVRRQRSLKQVDLARMVGVFQSEISEIEWGKRVPSVFWQRELQRLWESA
jgi:DNA-binding XRE family transcriptional regulator